MVLLRKLSWVLMEEILLILALEIMVILPDFLLLRLESTEETEEINAIRTPHLVETYSKKKNTLIKKSTVLFLH